MERLPYPDEREQAHYAHHYQPQGRLPEDRRPGAPSGVYYPYNNPQPPPTAAFPDQYQYQFDDGRLTTTQSKKNANDSSLSVEQGTTSSVKKKQQFRDQIKIDKKWQRRLYWHVTSTPDHDDDQGERTPNANAQTTGLSPYRYWPLL